jgi:hypothetical protein
MRGEVMEVGARSRRGLECYLHYFSGSQPKCKHQHPHQHPHQHQHQQQHQQSLTGEGEPTPTTQPRGITNTI